MFGRFARYLRFGPLAPLYEWYAMLKWKLRGRPIPPPYTVKRRMIADFARRYGCRTLVETGTFHGDTIWSLRAKFDKLYSIELDRALHEAAAKRFAGDAHISLVQGDSGEKLAEVARKIDAPTLFWLDGHYSGPGTARAEEEAPVMRELDTIFNHGVKDHIILLDDAREFVGRSGYPAITELKRWVRERRPELEVEVVHDVIRIYPHTRAAAAAR